MIPLLLLIAIAIFIVYYFFGARSKKTVNADVEEFDPGLLKENVLFYTRLSPEAKIQFEEDVRYFLSHTRITGVDTPVDKLDKLLVASAAVIPIFYFTKWKYHNLREVLLYADAINMQFESKGNADRNILGLVGTGPFEGSMLLSKSALRQGFSNQSDKRNTAIHEFVHLIDKSDGETDGIPDILLDKQFILPWLELMHKKMQQISQGKSDIDSYGLTNKAEFFAVVAEYFFERPALLEEKHPVLYKMLCEMFEVE